MAFKRSGKLLICIVKILLESQKKIFAGLPAFNTQLAMSLVIVEGNISAGKSTLCRDLANILDYELYLEPALSNPYLARVIICVFLLDEN